MRASEAMPAVEFQFTDPDDVAKYGDGWYRFSERDLIRRRARDLIQLEAELGMPIIDAMNGGRASTALGDLACTWIGVREVDPKLAGPFDEYNPLVMQVTWRKAQEVDEGKAEDRTEPAGTETATPEPAAEASPRLAESGPAASVPTDTVALQTLPVAG